MTRPTDYPEWATLDDVDPTSGQNNVVDPPAAWKDYGWAYQEKPPRNYDNWFKRTVNLWVQYMDGAMGRAATVVVAANDASAESKAHADYVCDGVNDEVELQAALTAVAITGGKVLLTEGTFSLKGGLLPGSDTTICGMGMGCTKLKMDDANVADFSIIKIDTKTNVGVFGLSIDGNKALSAVAANGIEVEASTNVVIRDVRVEDIDSTGGGGYGILINDSTYVRVESCPVYACETTGISLTGTTADCAVRSCRVSGNSFGVVFNSDHNELAGCTVLASVSNNIVVGGDFNRIIGCASKTAGDTGMVIGGNYNLIKDNQVVLAQEEGVRLTGAEHNLFSGNIIYGCSQLLDNGHSAFDSDVTSGYNMVCNNIVVSMVGPAARHAVGMGFANTDDVVNGNDLSSAGVANLAGDGKTIPIYAWDGAAQQANDIDLSNKIL